MKLSSLLSLPPLLLAYTFSFATAAEHRYNEQLDLTPLAKDHLHADFTFSASTPLTDYASHNYRYFPRSLAQILQSTRTVELHLRFALGRWDDEAWGPRPKQGRREGGTGVEIWAWLEGHDEAQVEERWSALVNALSGLFCASLNFINGTRTTSPLLTFDPEGTIQSPEATKLMHGVLPREVICTENLTPFLKLLPCKGKAGISSLLDGHKLFDSTWQTMSIDVSTRCDSNDCTLSIEQAVSMALSIPRSMRDTHDPIPRPAPVEDIDCDESKSWHGHDHCYPKPADGQMAWTLSKVFGRSLKDNCSPDGEQSSFVRLLVPQERQVEVLGGHANKDQTFVLGPGDLDLNVSRFAGHAPTPPSSLLVSRQMTGQGQERGGMQTTIRNAGASDQRVVLFESLPWFVRPFMHTLTIKGGTIETMYYTPLIDRRRGTHLELLLNIPANSTIVLSYDIEKAILRYTEYPPDANRGFDIGSAIIRVLKGSTAGDEYLRTTSLLLPLPTPDFSMPYNVIILTSTVIALGFGSIFNLLVRRFVLLEEVPKSPLSTKLQAIIDRWRKRFISVTSPAVVNTKPIDDHVDKTKISNGADTTAVPTHSTEVRRIRKP